MGKYKYSRFLDEVHEKLRREMGDGVYVDRLWVEWRVNGWRKLVRVGNYLPYLRAYDGVAIEVIEPYREFRLVNGARGIEARLGREELIEAIGRGYRVNRSKIKPWNGRGMNAVEFRERNWWFSDFHYLSLPKNCYMFDLDVVIAVPERIVRAWDIKWGFDHGTEFERRAYYHAKAFGIEVEEIYVESPQEAVEVISYEAFRLV